MTNRINRTVLLGLSAAALSASPMAFAQSSPVYLGGGLGYSTNKFNSSDFNSGLPPGTTQSSKDERDTGYKLFGGYKFNQNWAAELGYTDLGKFSSSYTGASTANANYKTSAWSLAAVGTLPLSGGFSLLGKLGATYNKASLSIDGATGGFVGTSGGSKRKSGVLWGGGLNYDFTPTVGLRLEYEDYGNFGNTFNNNGDTGRGKDSLWSANVIYRF